MENPCYVSEGEGGELRRWHSVPVKGQQAAVSTIYRPEEYGERRITVPHHLNHTTSSQPTTLHKECPAAWRLEFLPTARPHATLLSALLLATFITLAATAALLYLRRAVHTRYPPAAVVPDPWTAEMVVNGEFRVSNEAYRPSLENMTSQDFKQLSWRIGKQLEKLFKESLMSDHFKTATVVSFSPGLVVHCSLILHPTDMLTVSKVGLAFLGGLKHAHGHLWLGKYMVDVQSIGFQASTAEVTWSQWSNWSECSPSEDGISVRTRKRICLSLSDPDVKKINPCQLGSLQEINDTETEGCPPSLKPSFNLTTVELNSTSEDLPVPSTLAPEVNNSILDDFNSSSTIEERRTCSECEEGEVCVAIDEELVPYCRKGHDLSDPTGCGGLCKINTEVCYRLRDKAYRCVDDSKCLDDEWQCGNKLCIPLVKRCDGHFNCYDHTDEYDCECNLITHFHCGKNSSCIPKSKKCDGIVDCWDAADEVNCTVACLDSAQFTCNDSQCIPSKNFCDGFPDCKDHSDEPFGCGGVCKNHEWRCSNGRCIVRRDVCNGIDDCGDGSDELKCGKRRNVL